MYRTIYDKKMKQWSGQPKIALYNPNVSVGQVILEALHRAPDKIGQVNEIQFFLVHNKSSVYI